jgi:2-oxoglutarate ferredoxin oxidoreductase subunit gamma
MNAPSFEKFEPLVSKGGLLVVNESIVPYKSERRDIQTIFLPFSEIAAEVGSALTLSVVALGAFNAVKKVVSDESIEKGLDFVLPAHRKKYLDINIAAYKEGKKRALALIA